MSHFSEELIRQFELRRLSQASAAERSGISQAQISKWVNSDQTSISDEQLTALALALSDESADHVALVRAHLLDEKFGPGSELVRIEIDDSTALNDRPRPRSKGEKALHFLAEERLRNRDLNDLLIDLAKVLGGFDPVNSGLSEAESKIVAAVKKGAKES